MAYIDTSILVAYYCPESISDQVESVLLNMEKPSISPLTEVELVSVLSRKIRERALSKEDGNQILTLFNTHISQKSYDVLPIQNQHFRTAFKWISEFKTPLRTLDALHLSIAMLNTLPIVTADAHLNKSATILGISSEFIS